MSTTRKRTLRVVQPDLTIYVMGKLYRLPHEGPFIDLIRLPVEVFYHEADLSMITVVAAGQVFEVGAAQGAQV